MVFDFRLKVFVTVAQKLSFTKAANELFITQPAVTKHINELEGQLEARLFHRKGTSITLTPAGEVMLAYAERIFKMYAELDIELSQLRGVDTGSVQIGASTTIAQYVIPKLLAMFKKAYPMVEVHLMSGNTEAIEQALVAEKIQVGMVEGASYNPQLHYEGFVKDEIVLVTRVGNKWLSRQEIRPEALGDIPLILREHGSGTLEVIFKELVAAGVNPKDLKVAAHLDSTEAIKQYLLFSDTAAFLSVHSITKELQHNQLAIIDIKGVEICRMFQFVQLQGAQHKMGDLLKRYCQNNYNIKL